MEFAPRRSTVTLRAAVSFKYDPFGRRIYKSSSSATSVYAYDGDNLIEETNSSGTVVARYSQGLNIDEPLAMLRSSTTSYYQADGLGSITSLSSGTGALSQTYTFDSFGKQTASSGSLTNPFHYTAREFDVETGLYYYRARYYDPGTGRLLSEDPLGFNAELNFYRYAANAPVTWRDPQGKDLDWGTIYGAYNKALRKGSFINCFVSQGFCANELPGVKQGLDGMTSEQELNTAIAIQQSGNPNNSGAIASNNRLAQGLCQTQNCLQAIQQCIDKIPLAGPISTPPLWKQIIKFFSGPGASSSQK